jgi:hypothetical protein
MDIYATWKGLGLMDTFTVVCNEFDKSMYLWREEYFFIYIYSLFSKYYIYIASSEISKVKGHSKRALRFQNEYLEFVNDFYVSSISYKFLQNAIYRTMRKGLEVEHEIEQMEEKINRIRKLQQENYENVVQFVLFFLSGLTIVSVINDAESLLTNPVLVTINQILLLMVAVMGLSVAVWWKWRN